MANKKPLSIYVIREGKEGKNFWTRIGVAFRNRDGSLACKFDALPVGGECQIREDADRDERDPRP